MIRKSSAPAAIFLGLACCWAAACVGDDPSSVTNAPADAGSSTPPNDSSTTPPTDGPPTTLSDAGEDSGPSEPCDPSKPFLAPEIADDLNDKGGAQTISVRLSYNGLTAFYSRGPFGGDQDLYRATRATTNDPFGAGTKMAFVNGATTESKPSVTDDFETLYFYRSRGGALSDIVRAGRTANGYETVTVLGPPVNTTEGAQDPFISKDGMQLFFTTQRGAGALKSEIYVATTPTSGGFATLSMVTGIDTLGLAFVDTPVLSYDMLTLYFGGGSATDTGVYTVKRPNTMAAFADAQKIKGAPELDLAGQRDEPSFITPDECTLYMYSNRSGIFQTYRARRQR